MVVVLLALLGTGFALAADGDQAADSSPAGLLTPSPLGEEIPALRTATSQTFELPSGERQTKLFQSPINFKEDGKWRRIDSDLEDAPGAGLTNGQNSFDLRLPDAMGEGSVRFAKNDRWVSSRLLGHTAEIEGVEGATATYETAGGAVAFDLTSTSDGVKEEIQLDNSSAPSTFAFELDASQGLTPELAPDGSIRFNDEEGDAFAMLPAPTIADSSATTLGLPGDHVAYTLTETGSGSWRLAVTADREWLDDPVRVWPVTIDPTIVGPGNGQDCILYDAGLQNYNLCASSGWPQLVGVAWYGSTSDQIGRSIMQFNLSGVPAKADVTDATLNLYSPSKAQNSSGVQIRRLTSPWGNTATWNCGYYSGPTCIPWKKPGGDFTEEGSEVLTSERGIEPGAWTFKGLEPVVQGWISGSMLGAGLLLKLKDESPHVCCIGRTIEFASSAAANPAQRPSLTVTYLPQAPSTSKVVSPSEGTRTAKRLKLKAAWSVSGVVGVKWQFREGKSGNFQDIPAGLVRTASNEAVSWPVPTEGALESKDLYFDAAHASPTLRSKGGSVQIRAYFEGAKGIEGVSDPVEAEVNRFLGGPKDATAEVGPGTVDLLTGNLTISRTDVSIPTFNSSLDFSRTYNSRDSVAGYKSVLGRGWKPGVAVEESGAGEWRSVNVVNFTDGEHEPFSYALITNVEGFEIGFAKIGGEFFAGPEAAGWTLTSPSASQLVLSAPDGSSTTFQNASGGSEYLPIQITEVGSGKGNSTRMLYDVVEGNRRLSMVIGSTPNSTECPTTNPPTSNGCRVLVFKYKAADTWGGSRGRGDRLSSITYYAPGNGGPWEVAKYAYDDEGRLTEAWDPRISPALKEKYTYTGKNSALPDFALLKTLTPPGQEPWTMEYGAIDEEEANGRLMAVKRASLLSSPSVAQTTIAYGVPVSGSGAPYDLSSTEVSKWSQQDLPVDATAIFPPDQIPSGSPPSSYSRATVYYMDVDGFAVNTATPAGAGTTKASISTAETDEYGNAIRELTPENRVRALEATNTVTRSKELATTYKYGAGGTEMQEEVGPLHSTRLASGTTVQARAHKTVQYETPGGVTPNPHLPTRETSGALVGGELLDRRVVEMTYDWNLRQQTESIVDPGKTSEGHLDIHSTTAYDSSTGLPTEIRQPSNPSGGGAGTTKITYYKASNPGDPACASSAWIGLPCKFMPAAQPGTAGQPDLVVKWIASYSALGQPTEVVEAPGAAALAAGAPVRKTTLTYDAAGRLLTSKVKGGGTAVPKVELAYNTSTGFPVGQKFVCEESCSGFNDQATTTTYDALGRPTKYEDANGNISTTTYDLLSRPATTADGKGTQARIYDPTSGLLAEIQDSAAGTFTASYDANGSMVAEGLPNGLVAKSTYDEAGQLTDLSYNKTACSENCTWLDFSAERSIDGQILRQQSLQSTQEYSYDKSGRLVKTNDTPAGNNCTTRTYKYDVNSNRKSMGTVSGVGATCSTSEDPTPETYNYDAADRLIEGGIAYDEFGRVISLPASYAGGKVLTSSYFSTDMVASQSQNGVTNTFLLDSELRQSQRVQGGGFEGTEVFHYATGVDTPVWTQLGTSWTRNIAGIGGEIAAVQDSNAGTTLQLTNLHGDVVATASLSTSATEPTAAFEFDEFGNPNQAGTPQLGWLGSQGRRTEFGSGVIQMGKRSYVPTIGRFLSTDPVSGGSASAYEYANADPVNGLDLTGEKAVKLGQAQALMSRPAMGLSGAQATRSPASAAVVPIISVAGVIDYLKDLIDVVAPVDWTSCVPQSEIGPDKQAVREAFGKRACIPKLKYHVTNIYSAAGLKSVGYAWCIVTNAWARFPVRGAVSWFGATAIFGAWCSGERAWAYLYFY